MTTEAGSMHDTGMPSSYQKNNVSCFSLHNVPLE